MGLYRCKICGKIFERVGNGVYCEGPHYRPCPVCGEPVAYHRPGDPYVCCSKECSKTLSDRSKMKSYTKICKECGKEFHPKQANQKFCSGPHVSKCVICGNEFEYTCRPTEKPKTCSSRCREILKKQNNLIKYGVSNVYQLDEVRSKISEVNSSEEVRNRRESTNLKRYGAKNVSKSDVIRKKIAEIQRDPEFLIHRYDRYKELTGYDHPMQNPDTVDKLRKTNLERYGTTGHPHSTDQIIRMMVDGSKVDDYLEFKDDPRKYVETHFDHIPVISELEVALGVTNTPIYNILIESNSRDVLQTTFSSMEDEVVNFIQSVDPNVIIIRGDRTVIRPLEIDIYLPEHKIGIECNPVVTHNSSFVDPWGYSPKSRSYHKNKSDLASLSGIFLFHIFGYEWNNKKNIIKSMIRNLMNRNEEKYGARNTYISKLSYKECEEFLNKNHRQGNSPSSIRLGLKLVSTDELVSVMTFGRLRSSMGKTKDDSDVWELVRFCNKLNTTVCGSASKLLNYFISQHEFSSIVSFSDVAHTRGNIYEKLGFKQVNVSEPSYVWVDMYDQVYYHRVTCQKRNLRNLFKDPTIDIENRTEVEIMNEHKFAQVFDSGVIRWEFNLS